MDAIVGPAHCSVQLGLRPEPALPENSLVQLLELAAGEFAVLDGTGMELSPGNCFGPLTRSGIRRACGEGAT